MGFRKRAEKNKSILGFAENSAKKYITFLFLISFFIFGLSCVNSNVIPVKKSNSASTSNSKNLNMTAFGLKITSQGFNSAPSFSKNAQKILFVSRDRATHKQSQVYEFDLTTLSERRLTFQDGDCDTPVYTENDQSMVYASTTDEIKERPPILETVKKPENPTAAGSAEAEPAPYEIYKSDLTGSKIQRLTQHPGFDGDLFVRPDRPGSIVYSQWKNKKWEEHQLNIESGDQIPLLEKAQYSIENMRLSPSGKYWVWIERSTVNKSVEVVLAKPNFKKVRSLPMTDYEIESLTWGNDEVVVASLKMANEKNYQIYSYDIMSECLAALIKGKADLIEPKISADQKSVIFTAEDAGVSDIYLKSVTMISPTCLPPEIKN